MESVPPHGLKVKLNNAILTLPKWPSTERKPVLMGTANVVVANKKQIPGS